MPRVKSWKKVAEKEGAIYCRKKDTWCAFVNMNDGSCLRKECVNNINISEENISNGT